MWCEIQKTQSCWFLRMKVSFLHILPQLDFKLALRRTCGQMLFCFYTGFRKRIVDEFSLPMQRLNLKKKKCLPENADFFSRLRSSVSPESFMAQLNDLLLSHTPVNSGRKHTLTAHMLTGGGHAHVHSLAEQRSSLTHTHGEHPWWIVQVWRAEGQGWEVMGVQVCFSNYQLLLQSSHSWKHTGPGWAPFSSLPFTDSEPSPAPAPAPPDGGGIPFISCWCRISALCFYLCTCPLLVFCLLVANTNLLPLLVIL